MKRPLLYVTIAFMAVVARADHIRLSSRQVSTRDGLPGNTINEMVQSADGYIWMATNNGLSRYDGYATVNYATVGCSVDDGGEAERIGRITCDTSNHCLWVSTAIYTNACYDLHRHRYVDWSGEPSRQLNKFFLSSRGMFFYGMSFGVRHVEHGRVKDYTVENGCLPSNEVLMVLEDDAHNIWMPTDKGVCLLLPDGRTKTLLKNTPIVACATHGDNTFVLSTTGQVVAYGPSLEERQLGRLPVMTQVNTSFVWNGKWLIFMSDRTYAFDTVLGTATTMDIAGGRSQGTCAGYHFIANESGRLWIFPDDRPMQSMLLIPNAHFSSNRGRKFHVAMDRDGRLFIATYGNGLFVWHPAEGDPLHFTANDENPLFVTNYLTYAICDRQNNIWLGSEDGGAYCLSRRSDGVILKPEPAHRGDWTNAVSAVSQSPADGSIVVATRVGSVYNLLPLTHNYPLSIINYQFKFSPLTSYPSRVTALYHDRQGRLWTGTDAEGFYVNNVNYGPHRHDSPSQASHIRSFCEDAKGRMWIGTLNSGLLLAQVADEQRITFSHFLTGSMNESRVKTLGIDARGLLWIGTNNGLYCVDSKKDNIAPADFKCYNRSNGLFPHNEIFTLNCTDDTVLWVGAAGSGLLKCVPSAHGASLALTAVTTREGLPNNNVYSIAVDDQNNVWAGTEGGIACVDKSRLQVTNISLGSVATENTAIRTADGHVLMGTIDGLYQAAPFQPIPVQGEEWGGPPVITDIHINGLSVLESGRSDIQTLRHDENTLVFYFSNFRYNDASSVLYQYCLEGKDPSWQPLTADHRAEYRDLPPGRYVFHLRAMSRTQEWQQTDYAFVISQPWYNTWWAWLAYLLLAAAAVCYVYRNWREKFNLQQQMKLERQLADFRVRLFTNITHEFRTPLAIIKDATDHLDDKQAAVQTARRGVRRMLKLVNQFMDFRKASTGHLHLHVQQGDIVSVVRDVHQDFWAMAQQKRLQMPFIPFARQYDMPFDRDVVETVVYNLLSNAIKYTPEKGTVTLKLKNENGELKIICEDSGPGISARQQEVLFKPFMNGLTSPGGMGIGLYTSFVMAQTHHGTLSYQPAAGGGSVFTFTMPATDIYTDEERAVVYNPSPIIIHYPLSIINSTSHLTPLNDTTIAVIEDDPDMMEQIKHAMGFYFHVDAYMNGKTGYEGVCSRPPSLLVCDVMLPDMNGYDIVAQLKTDAATARIPVIMLTALADEEYQIKAYKAGADDFMTKPCNWRLLTARALQLIAWAADRPASSPGSAKNAPQETPRSMLFTTQADKVFMDKLQMLTAQHLASPDFNIDQLALLMNMGRTKFFGRVKEMTGLSPNKYIMKARMEKAAALLADGELNVSEVSYKVGIQDPSYFNKVFKAHYGVVPSRYVKPAE